MKSCSRYGAMHNVLLCTSDRDQLDKTFFCESISSDDNLTEDPESLNNPDKCFLTKRSKPTVEKNMKDRQMEEVKNLLKTLSAEQIEEIKRKESNDKVAFLQSGKCDDRVRLVCEEKDNTGNYYFLTEIVTQKVGVVESQNLTLAPMRKKTEGFPL